MKSSNSTQNAKPALSGQLAHQPGRLPCLPFLKGAALSTVIAQPAWLLICRHARNRNHSRGEATGCRRDHDAAYAARGPQNWISYRGPFADGYERSDLPSYWLSGVLYPPALQVTGEKVIALFMLRAYKRHTT